MKVYLDDKGKPIEIITSDILLVDGKPYYNSDGKLIVD